MGALDLSVVLFAVGVAIGALRPALRFPGWISRWLSRYLLVAIGLKGGAALAGSEIVASAAASIAVGIGAAFIVPILGFVLLRRVTTELNAAAIAAAYGSVSVVTFVTAAQRLEASGTPYGGYMTAVLALMESPAIFMAILLAAAARRTNGTVGRTGAGLPIRTALREALADRTQLFLLVALLVGVVLGGTAPDPVPLLIGDGFRIVLMVFLFDMGMEVAREFPVALRSSRGLLAYAVVAPVAHAGLALLLALLLGIGAGDAILLMVLSASASYIVVPAVLRHAIPEASPALYVGLSLGVTFPFNILIGIHVYAAVAAIVFG